jgi:inosine-uridine nucleoside N-ribohydrolase
MFQFGGQAKPPQGILFDSDFGVTIDSVLALALLHGLEGRKEARVASISINRPGLKAAQLVDVIEKFYASATTGPAAMFFVGTPIGLIADGTPKIAYASLLEKYPPRIKAVNDTAEPAILLRNALTAQYDGTAVIVLSGPATNLAALLALRGGPELVAQKVKLLSVVEAGLAADPSAADRVLTEWPSPIVAVRKDAARQILFPASSIEKDFAYTPNQPIADAYRAFHAMPYDAETPALAAALYAARPKEGYWKLSDPVAGKKLRYLVPDPSQSENILTAYTQLASAKPVARVPRKPVVDDAEKDLTDKPVSKPKP